MTGTPADQGAAIAFRTAVAGAELSARVYGNDGFIDRPSEAIAKDIHDDSHMSVEEDSNTIVVGRSTEVELSAPSEIEHGSDADLQAKVTSSVAGDIHGTVTVFAGDTEIAAGELEDGVFQTSLEDLKVGEVQLSAEFAPAEESAYNPSTSSTLTVNITPPSPHAPADPPAASVEELETLLTELGVDPHAGTQAFELPDEQGQSLDEWDPQTPLTGALPWEGQGDDYVDVYAYSVPTLLGSFPVVDGKVIFHGVDLSSLKAGMHTLVVMGQSSQHLQALAVTLLDPSTPPPGGTDQPDSKPSPSPSAPSDTTPGAPQGPDRQGKSGRRGLRLCCPGDTMLCQNLGLVV